MSAETMNWLNTMTLIGFTSKRGNAWHYRAADQGSESNHYEHAIPVEDVRRRLFNFHFVEGDLTSTYLTPEGVTVIFDEDRKTIIRPAGSFGPGDKGQILGVFKNGYQIHDYDEWLIKTSEQILDSNEDSGLGVASAGLLRDGGVAWVQYELPDTLEVAGFEYRPFFTAATSVDGTLSSTYNTGVQAVVCDNTLSAALSDEGAKRIKVRHRKNSLGRLSDVRDALGILFTVGQDFASEVKALLDVKVTDQQFRQFLDVTIPVADEEGRSQTMAIAKHEALMRLWKHDQRVAPWTGTKFGVLQAVNTFAHHEAGVKGTSRVQRNMLKAVDGTFAALDMDTLKTLDKVLALA